MRAQGLEASRGATNFGEYFLYFSFFLVVSALLLTALFFKLGVEQRLREIGLLQAIGYPASRVRKLFLLEGIVISIVGSVIGLAGALAYGQLMMTGLSTWWVEAVGTTMLKLHVAPLSLLLGAVGGVVAALVCIVWTLRRLGKESTRSLLTGTLGETRGRGETGRRGDTETGRRWTAIADHIGDSRSPIPGRSVPHLPVAPSPVLPIAPSPCLPRLLIAFALTLLGLDLLLLAASHDSSDRRLDSSAAGCCCSRPFSVINPPGYERIAGKQFMELAGGRFRSLGFRNATYRPGRSVLCIALIASAAFIIVSVDAFRRREGATYPRPKIR